MTMHNARVYYVLPFFPLSIEPETAVGRKCVICSKKENSPLAGQMPLDGFDDVEATMLCLVTSTKEDIY